MSQTVRVHAELEAVVERAALATESLMHTHQYSTIEPGQRRQRAFSSGSPQNRPVNEDSTRWASRRGYRQACWSWSSMVRAVYIQYRTTGGIAAVDQGVAEMVFVSQRVVYVDNHLGELGGSRTTLVGRFFRHHQQDYYGQRVIPEGNIEYNICASTRRHTGSTPQDI